ncbi:MAG TPA: polyphenol oxidase family protein [Euzebya sp.]|nr:polyphenol oxidase family protein [Euzebya sp.]
MSARVGEGDHRAARVGLASVLGGGVTDVAWMDQVHGCTVALVGEATDPAPTCDGIISATQGLGVAVTVADCVPVLLASPHAVAAAHAGRPGVVADVAGRTVERLAHHSGDAPSRVTAVIGPAIGACCYEVPAAMAADVEQTVGGTASTTTWGTPSIDLVAGVVQQLQATGVRRILRAGGCTRCAGDRWFSHRASTGAEGRPSGRQAGVVALPLLPPGSSR